MNAIHERLELQEIPAAARKMAAEAIGIDGHIDTVQPVLVMGEDLGRPAKHRRTRGNHGC